MKIFFDTNVYVAEALRGKGALAIVRAVEAARWKMYVTQYVLDETAHVLVDYLDFPKRLAFLSQQKITLRSNLVRAKRTAIVPDDPKDSPILQAALSCGADYLITNDQHLLGLNPYESLKIVSMDGFLQILRNMGKM